MTRKIIEWGSWIVAVVVIFLNIAQVIPEEARVISFLGALALLLLSWALTPSRHEVDEIVGAWFADAVAPYRPHLVTFIQTGRNMGVLIFSNPTNVQDGPNASVKVTDSTGHGRWRRVGDWIEGTMWQENALQPERVRGPRLAVTFRIKVTSPTTFRGPARAELIDPASGRVIEDVPSFLDGTRLATRRSTLTLLRERGDAR